MCKFLYAERKILLRELTELSEYHNANTFKTSNFEILTHFSLLNFGPISKQKFKIISITFSESIRGFLSPRHGVSPRVANGGVGHLVWRLAANILVISRSGVVLQLVGLA